MTEDLISMSLADLRNAGHVGNCNNCGEGWIEGGDLACRCEKGKRDFAFSDELIERLRQYHKARSELYRVARDSILAGMNGSQ